MLTSVDTAADRGIAALPDDGHILECSSAADREIDQAHWPDERHQDLIHDLGEQLIGRR